LVPFVTLEFNKICLIKNEMARVIVLTSEQWFLLSGTENTDGGLIKNLNEM
jgi:hypothetical protein